MSEEDDIITRLEDSNRKLIKKSTRLQNRVDQLQDGGCLDAEKIAVGTCMERIDRDMFYVIEDEGLNKKKPLTPCRWCVMEMDLRMNTGSKT